MHASYSWDDQTRSPVDVLEALEAFGCTFGLDLDGKLMFEVPLEGLTPFQLVEFIKRHEAGVAHRVASRASVARRVYHGGPLHGRNYGFVGLKRRIVFKCGPAKWAVYQVDDEWRAIFKGYASSQKRGRLGEVMPSVS